MTEVRDSGDLLVACQDARRRWPGTADLMNLIIDLLCEGDVGTSIDDALKHLARKAA
jgi:hypothetical protein